MGIDSDTIQPLAPTAVPSELMHEWAQLRYAFEVAKFAETLARLQQGARVGAEQQKQERIGT